MKISHLVINTLIIITNTYEFAAGLNIINIIALPTKLDLQNVIENNKLRQLNLSIKYLPPFMIAMKARRL